MRIVIVGGGQAGGWVAKTLSDASAGIDIILIADEVHPPYERPPLSKDVLTGAKPPSATYLWSAPLPIDMRPGTRATGIVRARKCVELASGEVVHYDKLVLATGARVRMIDIPGAHYLRTIDDSVRLRDKLMRGGSVLIVGGGWIGLEAAAAAVKLGCRTTVVESAAQLCGRSVPPVIGDYLLSLHARHGVDIRINQNHHGLVSDTTIVGVGITPNTELAEQAGLLVENGIVVDAFGCTSDPDIFAVGDIANLRGFRSESWANAQNQAIATAEHLLGGGKPYNDIPWFWSDQYNVNIQILGLPQKHHRPILRGHPGDDKFSLFLLDDERIAAFISVNNAKDVRAVRRFMNANAAVSAERLQDDASPLAAAAL